jgi:hypothetical protein
MAFYHPWLDGVVGTMILSLPLGVALTLFLDRYVGCWAILIGTLCASLPPILVLAKWKLENRRSAKSEPRDADPNGSVSSPRSGGGP